MRKKLADCLISYAEADERIFFITADLGFGVFDDFKSRFPERYLNVGIAEAGMVSIAAGLASEGWKPYVYSIASFLVPKTYEQIRLLLAHNQNKVVLIGAGGGFAYSMSGPSHHSLDDLSLALLIPELNVFAPSGPKLLIEAMDSALCSDKSSYIQIGKFGEPDTPQSNNVLESTVAIITTGTIANDAYNHFLEISKKREPFSFLNINRLNPLGKEELKNFLNGKRTVVVVEEMWGKLSLFTSLQGFIAQEKMNIDLIRIGPEHRVFESNFERGYRLAEFGLTATNLESKLFSLQEGLQ